jgi:hypothetical protein
VAVPMAMAVVVMVGVAVTSSCKPHYWVSSGGIFQNGIIRLFCNLENKEYSKME